MRTWEDCAQFHGHKCPGLAIGYRAAVLAMEKLGLSEGSQDEELVCISENDACGVDAIQVITGCTAGKGNLIFHMTGKEAYSFYCRKSGKSIRLVFQRDDTEKTKMSKEERMQQILTAPAEELFVCKPTTLKLPEEAKIFGNVVCAKCGETIPEPLARLENGQILCLDAALLTVISKHKQTRQRRVFLCYSILLRTSSISS